jgi:hypothetical protein
MSLRGFQAVNFLPYFHWFLSCAPLAQLDRVLGFEPRGREFESLRAYHFYLMNLYTLPSKRGLN